MRYELLKFIDKSTTAYQATETVKEMLSLENFEELKEGQRWDLKKEGRYYITKDDSAIIAFIVGDGEIEHEGFRIIGAHTDSPTFRIKPNPEIEVEKHYIKLNTEAHGGMILSTWFDRPLSIAGRVIIKGKSIFEPEVRLIDLDKPILIIPNLAIHLDRSINENANYNKQVNTLPLMGFITENLEKDELLINMISKELKVNKEDILDFDLYLYEYEKGSLIGPSNELISASRLDDLWMVFAGLKGFLSSKKNDSTKVVVFTSDEEIGSLTAGGADSSFIQNILERITIALNKRREEYFIALKNSIMISADLAHALHPNKAEKYDPTNKPLLGKGPVIKSAASGSYSSDGYTTAIFKEICRAADIPYQTYVNRSDIRGGTTIGPIVSSKLCIPVIDMGAPVLAMHSIRETAAVKDNEYSIKLFTAFFEM